MSEGKPGLMSREEHTIVYIHDDGIYGELISEGAFASMVRYSLGGVLFEVLMLNEDFDVVEEISIEIEEEY